MACVRVSLEQAPLLAACPAIATVEKAVLGLPGVAECNEARPSVLYPPVSAEGKMPFN